MATKIATVVKTPAMGESITEGTLTQWLKKVGDSVGRDEQVATIETDKIDVAVNSPEAGSVANLFAKEGDTVVVGDPLFEISAGAEGAKPKSAPAKKPAAFAKETKTNAPASSSPVPVTSPVATPPTRTPLIKFIGPRHFEKHDMKEGVLASDTKSISKGSSAKKTQSRGPDYESTSELSRRYQFKISKKEMDAIDSGYDYIH